MDYHDEFILNPAAITSLPGQHMLGYEDKPPYFRTPRALLN